MPPPVNYGGGGDIAVITCHFNWAGFKRPSQNFNRFLRRMATDNIPVFGVEAVLPDETPHSRGMKGWKQVVADPTCQILFQKERMLNMAAAMVPQQYRKIAYLDADVDFSNPTWLKETSALLDHFMFVQPFDSAVWTELDGRAGMTKPSTLRMAGGMPNHSHPGFAMAARRSLWSECGGLFDKLVVGNGDTAVAAAILNCDLPPTQTYSSSLMSDYMLWRLKVTMKTQDGGYGWTRGTVFHEWHGAREDRRYAERNKILKDVIPGKHLRTHENGLLAWTPEAPAHVVEFVRDYFVSRQEDGVPSTSTKDPHGSY